MKIFPQQLYWKIFAATIIFQSCDLPWEMGPQPKDIIKTEFESGLNIFGILRLDPGSPNSSFFHVERAYQWEDLSFEQDYFISDIDSAEIWVTDVVTNHSEAFIFANEFYRNPMFNPIEGRHYSVTIQAEGWPDVSGETTIPSIPVIEESQVQNGSYLVSVDSSATLVDIYIIYENGNIKERIANPALEDIKITPEATHRSFGNFKGLRVFAYDIHMANYLQAQITIKPQTYNEMVKTVEGGYGCFGSVSTANFKKIIFHKKGKP